jgi:hypothetical protein
MTTRQTGIDDPAGVTRLLKETADSLGVLIGDHIKLARIELSTDLRIYSGALGASLVAALLLLVGYLFAWEAAAFFIARYWGAPIALGLVAILHLTAGAVSLGAVSRKLRRTKAMRETVTEVRRSVRALAHPIEGQAP